MDAGYYEIENTVDRTCWTTNLVRELYFPTAKATIVYGDNISAV